MKVPDEDTGRLKPLTVEEDEDSSGSSEEELGKKLYGEKMGRGTYDVIKDDLFFNIDPGNVESDDQPMGSEEGSGEGGKRKRMRDCGVEEGGERSKARKEGNSKREVGEREKSEKKGKGRERVAGREEEGKGRKGQRGEEADGAQTHADDNDSRKKASEDAEVIRCV